MTLFEKSQSTLELPAVLALLAEQAVSEPAKAASLALRPSSERAWAQSPDGDTFIAGTLAPPLAAPDDGASGGRTPRHRLHVSPRWPGFDDDAHGAVSASTSGHTRTEGGTLPGIGKGALDPGSGG